MGEIPHKKLLTEDCQDIKVYVAASIANIKQILEPLMGAYLKFTQSNKLTILSFTKPSDDFMIKEILHYTGHAVSHGNMVMDRSIFEFKKDEKISFLKGFADVTGYVRRSNYFFQKTHHRVYLEIPNNWNTVIDICNLLYDLDVPVQNIDWAHPNIRDSNLKKYNQNKIYFWKKEHQIKIYVNEFRKIGFAILHKQQALEKFIIEFQQNKLDQDINKITHKYYWDSRKTNKIKPYHPMETDSFIPERIRGTHFNNWKEIANILGYRSRNERV